MKRGWVVIRDYDAGYLIIKKSDISSHLGEISLLILSLGFKEEDVLFDILFFFFGQIPNKHILWIR